MIQVLSVVFNISEGFFGKRGPICFAGSQGKEVGFPGSSVVKNPSPNAGDVGWEDPLKKEMATHSSILDWEIPWTEEPGRLQSMGS